MATPNCIILPISDDLFSTIDLIDFDLAAFKWSRNPGAKTDYAVRTIRVNKKPVGVSLHRVILARMLGRDLLRHERVDHVDLNGLNNCRENLRLSTASQNNSNVDLKSNNTTGYKGVRKHYGSYQAQIQVNKKDLYLGSYATPELAAIAYDKAALEHHGEFALTNEMIRSRK